ncbi:CDP-glycerol glycerophosphotransferase family protein [uncultured Methanobrevibacter sp.]|uniref:bifunctional glycosyltransferase/CDP-glycerol:glycerophosphate glycerophosphotransferase n=1 Tax=uncultured Methanobrevibacter sp. TaxID=253161 RepID=UPI0025FEC90E|nr:CDP-glycerol glycerophosphotransferase family protein [uncultured Methanobrevibacter sp.]
MTKFSIIIPVYNSERYLRECLDSAVNQTFKDLEIICINDGSTDSSESILKEYETKDERVKTYSQEHKGVGAARNYGMEVAQGEYINFLDSDDELSLNCLDKVNKFLKGNSVDVATIPIFYYNERGHGLNYKFNLKEDSKNRTIAFKENPDFIQSSVNSCFIKASAINDLKFDEQLHDAKGLIFINKLLLSCEKIGLVKDAMYLFRLANDKSLSKIASKDKEFYTYRLDCLQDLIDFAKEKEGRVPRFIQGAIAYVLQTFEKIADFPKFLTKDEIDGFWESMYGILENVEEEVISDPRIMNKKIAYFREFLIYVKNRKDFRIEKDEDGYTCLKTGDYTFNRLEKRRIFFDIIELKEGVLNLSGNFVSSCKSDALSVEAIKTYKGKKETFKGKYVEYPRTPRVTRRSLGIDWRFDYNFEFKIPIDKKGETKIDFRMILDENGKKTVMKNNITFRKFAEISKFSHYYIRNSQIIAAVGNSFVVMPYSFKKALRYELTSLKSIALTRPKYWPRSIGYRLLYLLSYPFMKNKKINMYMDRRENTGDNGEHLFRYAIEQKDGISKYFAVEKDCAEYKKLKKEYGKSILKFGSIKHKFLYMFSEKLISSQGYKKHANPFSDLNLKLVQGVSSPPIYFLQHGVGKYDMRSWLRKYDINFSLILTVSDYDQEAFVNTYNYDEEIIQELGFPRYDNLTNENLKKEIVIIPTWRKQIRSRVGLLASEYYRRWNNLLNDEKLLKVANENGYNIVFKPHPNSLRFLELFNTENVIVDDYRRFHDILCESALMITDYSSVNFDFAYLEKPVIYYQYGDDYHFEGEALIDDEKSTFGDIIKDEDELIAKIIEYIENDCKMEEKYIDRVNGFFKYHDKNNCKRAYEWILKH